MGAEDAPAWLLWLQESHLAGIVRDSSWLYAAAEIAHILSFVVAVGFLVVLDFRLIGLGRRLAFDQVAACLLPWSLVAFSLTIPTGILLLLPEAASIVRNPVFLSKMALILLAGANASLFHLGPWRRREAWLTGVPPLSARLSGAFSIASWVAVIGTGRLIAYF